MNKTFFVSFLVTLCFGMIISFDTNFLYKIPETVDEEFAFWQKTLDQHITVLIQHNKGVWIKTDGFFVKEIDGEKEPRFFLSENSSFFMKSIKNRDTHFTLEKIEDDGILLAYESRHDYRPLGRNLETIDRGQLKLKWRDPFEQRKINEVLELTIQEIPSYDFKMGDLFSHELILKNISPQEFWIHYDLETFVPTIRDLDNNYQKIVHLPFEDKRFQPKINRILPGEKLFFKNLRKIRLVPQENMELLGCQWITKEGIYELRYEISLQVFGSSVSFEELASKKKLLYETVTTDPVIIHVK